MSALLLGVHVFSLTEYVVQTNCRSYSNSCKTFNDYANDADTYFTSDTSFYFMSGTHHLRVTLSISNVVNLSFVGDDSNIILCEGYSILWTRSSNISWIFLNLMYNEANKRTADGSAIYFENSKIVTFCNATFSKLQFNVYSRAIGARSSSIAFESCKFENGRHYTGGTIHIEDSNATLLGHNYFLNNTAYYGGVLLSTNSQILFSGSGTFVGNYVRSTIIIQSSNVSFNGYFVFNDNQFNIIPLVRFSYPEGTIAAKDSHLTLQGLFYFANNTNVYGGAINLSNTQCLIIGLLKFASNRALLDGGAIYARSSSLTIQSDESASRFDSFNSECLSKLYPQSIIFCNNSAEYLGGAIHLFDSNMTLTGSVIFVANRAQSGGGISIYYSSEPKISNPNFLVFQEPLDMLFYENVAKRFGGAININDRYLDTRLCEYLFPYKLFTNKCFFTLKFGLESNVSLNFTSNQALAGAGIYGGAIQYCLVEIGNKPQCGYEVLQDLSVTSTKIQNLYDHFVPLKTRYCINGITPYLRRQSVYIRVQRGRVFNISVTVLGEFDFPVNERVAFTLNSNEKRNSSQIFGEPYNYLTEKGCRNLGFRILSEQREERLTLHSPKCLIKYSLLEVIIYLDECPPGFMLIKNACKCQEKIFKVTDNEDFCDSSTGLIKCPQQDWMKPILDESLTYQGFMWSPNCPVHLCHNDKDNWLNFSSDNVDFLCLEHRTAMLCGACLQNYSLTLSSLKCSKCNSNNYLSLLLVFVLAGVALIATSLLLRLTVADGNINGLIFYANITNVISDHIFQQDELPSNPLTVFISWLNLDFGIPTCFYTGLDYYSYTWLQFVFPFYLWFLVGLIILACKYSSRAMKLFGSNPVAVLATVVLMSYSKLLHTSQQILSYVTVYYSDGSQEKRWKMDPNLLFFQGKHIPLAIFGLFILIVFLFTYIILISFGHYLQNYSNKRGLKWMIKIKPILDAYYAPFCNNTRYWVGLMLFVRTFLSITYSTLKNTQHITILVIISSVLTGIAVIPWMQHKVYQKRLVNIFEGSFILNVNVLSIATHQITRERNNHQLILTYTSIAIAFIEFLVILFFHAWYRLNLKLLYMNCHNSYYISTTGEVLSNSNQCVSKVKNSEGKPGGNVSTTVFDIREPLLDDTITEL